MQEHRNSWTAFWFAGLVVFSAGSPAFAGFEDQTLKDAFAYWRLDDTRDEASRNRRASYLGPNNIRSFYTPTGVTLGEAILIPSEPTNTAVRIDGTTGGVNNSSHLGLNQGGPWEEKSILLWFKADNVNTFDEQALWEQGGTWRGLNIYIREGELFVGGWNNQNDDVGVTSPWISGPEDLPGGHIFLSTPISSDQTYQVGLVMAGDPYRAGTFTGYLNGQPFGEETGVGRLFEHPADVSIGRYRYNTYFESGEVWDEGTGAHFAGVIDEVAIYNMAFAADRIAAQYASAVLGATTYDCNSDGMLDVRDLNCTTINQLAEVLSATSLIQGDANGDGAVGFDDFLILSDNFGSTAPTPTVTSISTARSPLRIFCSFPTTSASRPRQLLPCLGPLLCRC